MPFAINGTPVPSGSANPSPAYTGVFIPQRWSEVLAKSLYDLTLAGRITASHWSTAISGKPGDVLNIMPVPRVTTAAYSANMGLVPQRPSGAITALPLDVGWYFSTVIDDVMKVQVGPDLPEIWGKQGALELKYAVENYLLNTVMVASIAATNAGLTAGALTSSVSLGVAGTPLKPYTSPAAGQIGVNDLLTRIAQVLDEAKVPHTDRWIVVPPWLGKVIADDDTVAAHGEMTTDSYGRLGRIARMDVYVSATLTSNIAGETVIIAGHPDAIAYGTQLSNVEEVRSTLAFMTYIRGICACGGKTVNNTLLAKAVVAR